ncbi:hypothetical protein [Marinomonas shanghaiensis]|uniref:hypothetical protein n=1 Tax=Marinomonas shanghaiensis TaxID=2202418 RepID=UPI003A947ED7
MSIKNLTNQGFLFSENFDVQKNESEKTFVVVGVARGGTSIVAGALYHLGVFMGNAQAPVYEDLRLSLAYEKQSKEKFEAVVADYNAEHDVWAWKRPSALNNLPKIAKKLRNPHFIFVFRDALSVANRNVISMKQGVRGGLSAALIDYTKIIKFIEKSNYPAFFVSSEKAVKHKESFIEALCEFCQLRPTQEQLNLALTFISPDPADYLAQTRINHSQGWVDKWLLQTGLLQGWAQFTNQQDKVAEVQVLVNGELLTTLLAQGGIEFSSNQHVDKASQCGFELDLTCLGVKPSDQVVLKIIDDVLPMTEKPLCYPHLSEWLSGDELNGLNQPKGALHTAFLQTGIVQGWAVGRDFSKPAKVCIRVNGDAFATIPATIVRPHLKQKEIHPTGYCGFELNIKQLGVRPSDSIEVSMLDEDCTFHQTPISYPDLDEWLTQKEWQERQQAGKAS